MRAFRWMALLVCGVSLACAAHRSTEPSSVLVDLSVEGIDMHVETFAVRIPEDWWAVGRPTHPVKTSESRVPVLQVVRSDDAGRSWRYEPEISGALSRLVQDVDLPQIERLEWYTPETGIAVGMLGQRLLRTQDGGRTWQAIASALHSGAVRSHGLSRAGPLTWLCGDSGHILLSDDQGASWTALEQSPFNDKDECAALSFLTPEDGWAVGTAETLWATQDGGKTWKGLRVPAQPSRTFLGFTAVSQLFGLVRLSPRVAWLWGISGLFKSADGGETWQLQPQAVPQDDTPFHVSRTASGRQVLTWTPPGLPIENWIPLFNMAWQATDHGVWSAHFPSLLPQQDLRFDMEGVRILDGPLLTRGQGVMTRLDGVRQASPTRWFGWAGAQVVISANAGRRWYRGGGASSRPIQELAPQSDGSLLAEVEGGRLWRSADEGRTWTPAHGLLDAYDFERVVGRAPGRRAPTPGQPRSPPESPFDCLLSQPRARLDVLSVRHGFVYTRSELHLERQPGGARLSGQLQPEGFFQAGAPVDVDMTLSHEAEARFLREWVEAATRPETRRRCRTGKEREVLMEWSCGSGPFQRSGTAEFRSDGCTPLEQESFSLQLFGKDHLHVPEEYARAVGLHEVARAALEAGAPERPADVPGAHPGATR